MSDFPVDDVTLAMLSAACEPDDDGRSHLFDFLDASDEKWSPHAVILSLCAEVQRFRSEVDDESFHKGYELGHKHGKENHLKEAEAVPLAPSRDAQVVSYGNWGRVPTDADLTAIEASTAAECHVLKGGPGGMVLLRDLTAEIRRLRD